jgi:F-type H+-transporting ATPase subunit alpha
MSKEKGAGSLTALPIIETQDGDVSAYIPTNVISITDGQIFLESDLFNSGQRPAINPGLSVSRVGGDAQIKAMKQTAGTLRLDLAQYRELAAFSQFASDLDESTRKLLERGQRLMEVIKQGVHVPLEVAKQIVMIYAGTKGFLDDVPVSGVGKFEVALNEALDSRYADVVKRIKAEKALNESLTAELEAALEDFKRTYEA